ncbi:hypothetical protein BUALT_Bualt03G0159400 [Buddleja alternifolia]|uniref:Retrotransposon gag domain-containing protein n=1 Tax=Buddleja alternifolia TaxID=168488 RepID=A0AAV6XVA9_9LAMI|nr:hypothetical protein BUALT_Bualt03G0159400 [Buddleja alternifolia]
MADELRNLDTRKELDAIREQIAANAVKSDKMFDDIQNPITAMATNPHPIGSTATMDNDGQFPTGRGLGTSSQGYHLPTKRSKVEFPSFNGEDLRGWLFRAEQFFEVDETPMETRVRLAAIYLEGKALQWHQNFMRTRSDKRMPNWGEYVTALQDRFGSFLFEDPMSELMNLRQIGAVKEYLDKFDELLNNVDLNESYAVSCFLPGLKSEIEVQVRMFKPKNLQEDVSLAKLQEQALILAQKRNHSTKPQPYQKNLPLLPTPSYTSTIPSTHNTHPISKPSTNTTLNSKSGRRLTPQEIDDKRAKGLCFLCDEKYTKEHICPKRKQLFLMEFSDEKGDSSDNENTEQECWGQTKEI